MDLVEIALSYHRRGWAVIPVPDRSKNPGRRGWQKERLSGEEIRQRFNGQPMNLGVLLGEPSGGLIDVDLDHERVISLAAKYLPKTTAVFGRTGKPRSHYLYRVTGPLKTRKFKSEDKTVLVEVRSGGAQTIFPPSTHPSGDPIRWEPESGAPAEVEPEELLAAAQALANAVRQELGEGPERENGQPAGKARHRTDDRTLALDALDGLNPSRADDYDEWVAVGMILHGADPGLLDEWDKWSQQSSKYRPGECASKWATFAEKPGGVGMGTLLEWARADGWLPPWERKPKDERSGDSSLPEIDATDQHLPSVTRKAWEAVRAANDPPRLFRYGGRVVRTEQGDLGELILRDVTIDRMRWEAAEAAFWYRWQQVGERAVKKRAAPTDKVIRNMLATPDIELPRVVRVVEAPVVAADGSILSEPGYHPRSRTYYAPADGLTVPEVLGEPTMDDVSFACDLLACELIGEFPFVSDAEKAHALGLLLLPFAHDLIDSCTPMHLFEKPSPGTGAMLLVEVLTFPSTGRPIAAMTEGRDEDEWRKRLTAKLRSGASFILIDNLKNRLDSAALSSAITATMWEDRLLGTSDTIKTPVRCGWIATGNNPAVSSEIARRTIRIRLDAKVDRPWLRTGFRHENLRQWAADNRGQLIWAALTLIRAWLVAGKPKGTTRLGMFESWSQTIGGILDVAGIPGFLGNLDQFYEENDAEGRTMREFIAAWWDEFRQREVGVSDLWKLAEREAVALNLGDGSERSQKTRLGKVLGRLRDRIFTIEGATEDKGLFDMNTCGGDGTHRVRVLRAGTYNRAQLWKLRRMDNATA